MNIIKNYLTNNDCYKTGRTITPIGIQIHTIGTSQNTASALLSYWNQPGIECCVHYVCDAETPGLAYQILPDNFYSWSDAGIGNRSLITIEQMESDYMKYTGGASYYITDETKFKADIMRSYNTCVELCAKICKDYGWNPWTKLSCGLYLISSHNEGRQAGLSSAHVDPDHVWSRYGLSMDGFRNAVTECMNGKIAETYRVGTGWKNGTCVNQLGAYSSLQNAKNACKPGYSVFNSKGKMVYTVKSKGTQAVALAGLSDKKKIKLMAPLYQACQEKTGMLASVGLAQFCLESGVGTTDLAVKANNLHGMKASLSGNKWSGSVWDGKTVYTKQTAEQDKNGNVYYVKADFRRYECMEDSIADRAAYFMNAKKGSAYRYPGIATITDPERQIQMIKDGGYATDTKYVKKLYDVIDKWNLTQYDLPADAGFKVGKKYKLLMDNYIRTAPSAGYIAYEDLPSSTQKKVVKQGNKVKLKAGNVVEALAVEVLNGNVWVQIKSGWLAAKVGAEKRMEAYRSAYVDAIQNPDIFKTYSVHISSTNVRIRTGAGTTYAAKGYAGKGDFTIVDEAKDSSGRTWGLLKAYESKRNGWIALWLDCVTKK